MEEKIKLLSIGNRKLKTKDKKNWKDLVDNFAPEMYDTIHAVGEEEGIKQIIKLMPEIIMIGTKKIDGLRLLIRIKQIHQSAVVLIMLDITDEEQDTIDEYMANGAYKCYVTPLIMDTLIHDMYVALNME